MLGRRHRLQHGVVLFVFILHLIFLEHVSLKVHSGAARSTSIWFFKCGRGVSILLQIHKCLALRKVTKNSVSSVTAEMQPSAQCQQQIIIVLPGAVIFAPLMWDGSTNLEYVFTDASTYSCFNLQQNRNTRPNSSMQLSSTNNVCPTKQATRKPRLTSMKWNKMTQHKDARRQHKSSDL